MTAESAAWRQVSARVARQHPRRDGHLWLELEVPRAFRRPEPGQFTQILLPPKHGSAFLPRPMSVAAAHEAGGRRVLGFLYAPVGSGTRSLAALRRGDEVEALGPLGRPFPLERPGMPVLVAGGRGVAPLLFAAERLAARGRRATFLFGARDRGRLVALEVARRAVARLGGRLHLCTDDGSQGFCGDVVALLEHVLGSERGAMVIHACGPHAMLRAVAGWARRRRGVEAWLAMESVMACGTGVCRGCPLPRSVAARRAFRADTPSLYGNRDYAMCCTDGPVFESRALDWERVH